MENFNVNRFFKVLNNSKLYIAFIVILSVVIGYFYSFYCVKPMYSSCATIMLVQNDSEVAGFSDDSITGADITLNQNLLSTYTKIAKSDRVLESVIANLNLDMSVESLYKNVSVESVNNTEVFKVSVNNTDAFAAASIANELVDVFSSEVQSLYNMNNVYIMDEAEASSVPFNINHTRDICVFGVMGLVFSFGLVVVFYLFDTTIKSEKDVEEYAGLSVLSSIPVLQSKNEDFKELIVNEQPKSPIAESFKAFRTNVMFSIQNKALNTILVTSSSMGEGKSFVSSNLAVTFAQSGKKVIIVDTDMRKGRLHKIFNLSNHSGLSNCLARITAEGSLVDINEFIQRSSIPNLNIITSGIVPPNPSELLSSPYMRKFLEALNSRYDVVICDGTPCMLVSDSIVLSKIVDTTIIVTSNRITKLDNLLKVKKAIKNVGGNIGGVIINRTNINSKSYNNDYYYGNHNETNFDMDFNTDVSDALLDIKLCIDDNFTFEDIQDDLIEDVYSKDFGDFSELSSMISDNSKEISDLRSLYKTTMQDTLNAIYKNSSSKELSDLKDVYENTVNVQNAEFRKLNDKISRISDSNVLLKLEDMKSTYMYNTDSQNAKIDELDEKVSSISDANVLSELDNMKLTYMHNTDSQNAKIDELNEKVSNISDTNILSELETIKDTYIFNINAQNAEIEEINNKISCISDANVLLELERIKAVYENNIKKQVEEFNNLNKQIESIDFSTYSDDIINKLENTKSFYEDRLSTQNEIIATLEEKVSSLVNSTSDAVLNELSNIKNIYQNTIDSQHEYMSSLEDRVSTLTHNNSEIILTELANIKDSYQTAIDNQDEYIASLEDRVSTFITVDNSKAILAELVNIKETYQSAIDDQYEHISSLEDKVSTLITSDSSKTILSELTNIRESYQDTINKQHEYIASLEEKVSALVDNNSETLLNELANIKNSYKNYIDDQNGKIEDLNNKISNDAKLQKYKLTELNDNFSDYSDQIFAELQNTKNFYEDKLNVQNEIIATLENKVSSMSNNNDAELLNEVTNIYKQLENINSKFDYLEKKASHNEELIKNIKKSNISFSSFGNDTLDTRKPKEKVISINDYLKNTNDVNIPKVSEADTIEKQASMIDNLIKKSKDTNTSPASALKSASSQESKKEKKRGFFRSKKKQVAPIYIEDETEDIGIVSQILAKNSSENVG